MKSNLSQIFVPSCSKCDLQETIITSWYGNTGEYSIKSKCPVCNHQSKFVIFNRWIDVEVKIDKNNGFITRVEFTKRENEDLGGVWRAWTINSYDVPAHHYQTLDEMWDKVILEIEDKVHDGFTFKSSPALGLIIKDIQNILGQTVANNVRDLLQKSVDSK